MLIDTHCHLNDSRLTAYCDEIVNAMQTDGLEAAVCVGYDTPSSLTAVCIAEKYDKIYAAIGTHPHDSKLFCEADGDLYAKLAKKDKVVAIGETGLDYFYDLSPRDVQKKVFVRQLELANSVKLPVILHVRDAYEDTRKILEANKGLLNYGVVLHCYSGSAEYVGLFNKFDAYYSFGGAITFKNAKHNLEALQAVPLDRLMLETDCPYMTPTPFRGKTNFPKYVNIVADKAAEVLNIDVEKLSEITSLNAKNFFKKMK